MLRNGLPLEQLRDEDAFQAWVANLVSNESSCLVRCYAVADGLAHNRTALGLWSDNAYRERLVSVWIRCAVHAAEQLNKTAFDDIMLKFGEASGPMLPRTRRLIQEGNMLLARKGLLNSSPYIYTASLMLGNMQNRLFGPSNIETGRRMIRDAFDCITGVDRLRSRHLGGDFTAKEAHLIQLLLVEIVRVWLDNNNKDDVFDLIDQEEGDDPKVTKLMKTYRSGKLLGLDAQIDIDGLLSQGNWVALTNGSALLETRVKCVRPAKSILERVLNGINKKPQDWNVALAVDWYDTCSKLFEATGHGRLAARAHDCVEDIYLKRKMYDKIPALDQADLRAMERKPVARMELEELSVLRDAVINKTLVKLVA